MSIRKNFTLLSSLLILSVHIPLYAADSSKPTAVKPTKSKKNTVPQIDFEVSVEEKGDYYISFVMYGNFDEKYSVLVDGHKKGFLNMNSNGLQNAFYQKTNYGLDPETICLKKGSHTVSVLGINKYEVPNVLEIKVGESIDEAVVSIEKPSFDVSESTGIEQMASAVMSTTVAVPPDEPYYEYEIHGNASFSAGTYTLYFNFKTTTQVTMNVDPIGGKYPHIFLFKHDDPANHTQTSNGNNGILIKDITATGYYRCVVAANSIEGMTNLHVTIGDNPEKTYSNIQVKTGKWYWFSNPSNNGTNFFTSLTDGDPVMYVLDKDGKVRAWNDDGGDIWHRNSYCNWPGAVSAEIIGVLLFNYYLAGSGTADLYAFVKTGFSREIGTSGIDPDKIYMISSGSSEYYNCYAWSGGRTDKIINRTGDCVLDYDRWIGNEYRYAGAVAYERCMEVGEGDHQGYYDYDNNNLCVIGGYVEDAVIDLWGTTPWADNTPEICVNHATVSKRGNNHYHGFAWESKDDKGKRFFHERDIRAFYDGKYHNATNWGHIICSYRPATTLTANVTNLSIASTLAETADQTTVKFSCTPKMKAMGINHPLTFEESVELGLTVLRNAVFTEDENLEVEELAASVSENLSSEYSLKLATWKKTWKDSSSAYMNNLKRLDKSNEHTNLKDFYKEHKEKIWPLLIKMVKEENIDISIILEDALSDSPMGEEIIDEINAELSVNQFDNEGALIVTDSNDRSVMICKKMLQKM